MNMNGLLISLSMILYLLYVGFWCNLYAANRKNKKWYNSLIFTLIAAVMPVIIVIGQLILN